MATNSVLFDSIFTFCHAYLHRRRRSKVTISGVNFYKSCLLLLLTGLLFTGCASLPKDYPRTKSKAFPDYLNTSVGQLFEEAAVQHPGESGFAIIRYGRPAFTDRIVMTELAEQVIAYMDEGVRSENSYRLLLDEDLVWITEIAGLEVRYYKEPKTTLGQRFMSGFIMILPVEDQL